MEERENAKKIVLNIVRIIRNIAGRLDRTHATVDRIIIAARRDGVKGFFTDPLRVPTLVTNPFFSASRFERRVR